MRRVRVPCAAPCFSRPGFPSSQLHTILAPPTASVTFSTQCAGHTYTEHTCVPRKGLDGAGRAEGSTHFHRQLRFPLQRLRHHHRRGPSQGFPSTPQETHGKITSQLSAPFLDTVRSHYGTRALAKGSALMESTVQLLLARHQRASGYPRETATRSNLRFIIKRTVPQSTDKVKNT